MKIRNNVFFPFGISHDGAEIIAVFVFRSRKFPQLVAFGVFFNTTVWLGVKNVYFYFVVREVAITVERPQHKLDILGIEGIFFINRRRVINVYVDGLGQVFEDLHRFGTESVAFVLCKIQFGIGEHQSGRHIQQDERKQQNQNKQQDRAVFLQIADFGRLQIHFPSPNSFYIQRL